MDRYKPLYLGKVMPEPENTNELTDFLANKYSAFNNIYDVCKEHSEQIDSIESVQSTDSANLTVKIITDSKTIKDMQEFNIDGVKVGNTGIIESIK